MSSRTRPTVADMLARKGRGQMSMLYVETPEEAAAAAAAGIDLLSIEGHLWSPEMRAAAGDCFVQVGLAYGELATWEDYIRAAHKVMMTEGDCCYCAASVEIVRRLRAEGIPVVGHVGLVPSQATWTGGFRAVGKTAESAMEVFRKVKALEEAGAFAAELEVVPDRIAAEISKRTPMLMFSMGAGTGGDAQYLFTEDVLGFTRGHLPRHAKVYRDFRAEYARLQAERIAAFGEFRRDVETGAYPAPGHLVPVDDGEFDRFIHMLPE
jgi:3-methyl-2-oxobutanoate hydroxymethyltransferase